MAPSRVTRCVSRHWRMPIETVSRLVAPIEIELAALLLLVASRCETSFMRLHRLTRSRLLGVILNLVGERPLAEEALQEAYVKIWHQAAHFDRQKGRAMAWLATICRHTAIDQLRNAGARPKTRTTFDEEGVDPCDAFSSDWPEPDAALVRERGAEAVRTQLAALACGPRESLTLSFYDGLSHHQIATRMGQPLGTVKSWVRRALLDLRPALEDHR